MLLSSRSPQNDLTWREIRRMADRRQERGDDKRTQQQPRQPTDQPSPQKPIKPQGDVDAPGKTNPPPKNP